ncbi:MAG TPA: hypothetical protein VFG79_24090 [Solirubrobacter sp.]|nr:hypothetical protein [Solirubrobacter sp.]
MRVGHDLLLDLARDPLGLRVVAVQEQPARALRDVTAHQQDAEAHRGGQPEREPPAEVLGEQIFVQ